MTTKWSSIRARQNGNLTFTNRPITLSHPPFDVPPEASETTQASPVRLFPEGRGADWDGEVPTIVAAYEGQA